MSSPAKPAASAGNEQVLFLLACIKFSENGRPNFEKVAADCGITSKGAAAKRYERLLKANGIPLPSQRGKDGEPATPTPKKRSKPAATDGEDDEESPSKKPRAKMVAMKKVDQDESDAIKNEEED